VRQTDPLGLGGMFAVAGRLGLRLDRKNFQCAVFPARDADVIRRRTCEPPNRSPVTSERGDFMPRLRIPKLDSLVVAGGCEDPAIPSEANRGNRPGMSCKVGECAARTRFDDTRSLVPAAGSQQTSVWRPSEPMDSGSRVQSRELPRGTERQVKNLHFTVPSF